ncbi:hypothetical protein SEA_PABST_34 [Microbacterium phage Pabst]|nr:hypothetical protein SEA_PABST_34 [Microbacterium phage Pabst]
MDPVQALAEIIQQLNELSGAALDIVSQALGGAEGGGGAPAPEGGEAPPAPPADA